MPNLRKKILILATRGDIGGVQVFVLNLSRELMARGIDVSVGYGPGDYLPEELVKNKIPGVNFKWLKRTHNPLANLFFIFELKKIIDKNNFQILHINSANALFGVIGAKLSKVKPKTVYTIHGLSVIDKNYKKNKGLKTLYRLFYKIMLKLIDELVFISNVNHEEALEQGIAKRGSIIYNGLDSYALNILPRENARRFIADKIRVSLDGKFIIGSIGRLSYQKNYEFLFNEFSRILNIHPNCLAIIIGEGEDREKYESIIKKLSITNNVLLLGEIIDAHKYLRAFDLFVLPSRYEGLPITLIESMFAAVPCLVTNVGGNAEILNNDARQLFELNNANDFLNKLRTIIKDKPTYHDLITHNQKQANNFQLSKMVNQYINIYQ